MLQYLFRNTVRGASRVLLHKQLAVFTGKKSLADKKKKIYESQSIDTKKISINSKKISQQQEKSRIQLFQKLLFEFGKDMLQLFNLDIALDRKKTEITHMFFRHQDKIIKDCQSLNAIQLINYFEIAKNMSLTKLEDLQQVQAAYQQMEKFVNKQNHLKSIQQHFNSLWNQKQSFQIQIRSICLINFLNQQNRSNYLKKVIPLVKYFKTTEILILLYQKWRYKFQYPYELLSQIHNNQIFISMEDINQSYYKMLFIESIKGQFIAYQDGIYCRILTSFHDKPNVLAHSAFNKFIKILHSQSFFIQTENTRSQLQFSLNAFINIAKNQNYYNNVAKLPQLVQIYLEFQQSNSTGQILLNQITYLSKTTNFKMNNQSFPLYLKLLENVLKNISKKLKYERRDFLNKEYTYDTINFLNQFIPKYLQLWPEVIFQLNQACSQFFPPTQKSKPLLKKFQNIFQDIVEQKENEINLCNIQLTLKVLRFMNVYKEIGVFQLKQNHLINLLESYQQNISKNFANNQELQVLYLILSLLQNKCSEKKYCKIISRINSQFIEMQMNNEIQKQNQQNLIKSFDHNIIWLSLINAKLKYYGIPIDQSIVQIFVNHKLYYMINNLQYKEVYQILVYTLGLSRIKSQIYQRILYNLSTFIIYIDQKNQRNSSSFYLNHNYTYLYVPICRLILENKHIFKAIKQKDAFKVVQIMMLKNITHFSNDDILVFLQTLENPSFLSISLHNYIQQLRFTPNQLYNYEHSSSLRSFEYYNKSLLRYFQGKYNQTDIKNSLKRDSLTRAEIQGYFSKIEVYKTIIMDGQLSIRFQMPEPKTNIPDFKYMYACQRIYQKIKLFRIYDFQQGNIVLNVNKAKDVDLSMEKNYISRQVLLPQNTDNQFRIQNRNLPKYMKLQVWKTFIFFKKQYMIDPKDLFQNSKKLTDQILNKVMKGVFGSFQKIRQVVKQFSYDQELVSKLHEQDIMFDHHGAALEFGQEDDQKKITLLCSSNTNYKIIYICAYLIEKHGRSVFILKENQKIQPVINFLKAQFPKKVLPQVVQIEVEEEEIQAQE